MQSFIINILDLIEDKQIAFYGFMARLFVEKLSIIRNNPE